MKRIAFFIFIAVFSACSSKKNKQDSAENLVKQYLKTTLNDPGSYEGVSFDTLRTSYEEYATGDPAGRKLDTLAASFIDSASKYQKLSEPSVDNYNLPFDTMEKYAKLDTLFMKKSDSVEAIIKIKGKGFKGRIISYGINHTFRAKNGFGGLVVYKKDFWIDSTLTKVVNMQDARE